MQMPPRIGEILEKKQGTYCRCGRRIIWMTTNTGKKMPVDHEPEIENEKVFIYSHPKMFSHFKTCPFASKFRKQAAVRKKED